MSNLRCAYSRFLDLLIESINLGRHGEVGSLIVSRLSPVHRLGRRGGVVAIAAASVEVWKSKSVKKKQWLPRTRQTYVG